VHSKITLTILDDNGAEIIRDYYFKV
ncbi:fimbrial chaperone protein SefB, partial [Salmonella enterica]|nr:fimbrial chaperone protein SefB [Salmonella enterica]HAE6093219.1 fimbrial chaperone protein SefB [Salmonella enterica subsp. enterica serovar Paratyphi A]ECP3602809.1 fimbrial chaperone protein SefB [Salmonella enterica]ECU9835670.1 fimbrial chaperone protein SefB [Salmonella enterica]MFU52399.1 fimbrial chaperone protein SefB [Salmonella enterica]